MCGAYSSREGWQATMMDLCLRVRWSSGDHFRSDFPSQILTALPSNLPTFYTVIYLVVQTYKVGEILLFSCSFCVF